MDTDWESHWDEEVDTVPPEDMTEAVLRAYENNPEKQRITRYIQPHYPSIGPTGHQIERRTISGDGVVSTESETQDSVWERLRAGDFARARVRRAYRENRESVRELLDILDGTSVITSDHGNAFDRFGVSDHPGRRYIESLVKVPWLEGEFEQRRTVTPGVMTNTPSARGSLDGRLSHLGYK